MAANNSTKRKSPAPKQTKTVKQSPDQITLEETVVETPKSQKPKKNTELKAQREAIEKAKAEAPKKKPVEEKKDMTVCTERARIEMPFQRKMSK